MSVPSLLDLTLGRLANDPEFDIYSAYEQFLSLFDDGRRTDRASTFLNKFLELLVQRRVVWRGDHYIRRFALAIPTALRHVRTLARRGRGGVDAQSECAHSFGVFCVKPIHMIIWDISYHGYHGLRPRIRLAHSPLATVRLSDEKPHVNVCRERRAQGRRLLGCIWALGGPTSHVRDVHLTPNGIRFSLSGRTPGEVGRTPTVCKHVGSIHSIAGLSGVLGHLLHPSLPLCASGCARFPFWVTHARSGDARYTTGYCPGGTMSADTGPYLGLADMFSQCQSV